MNSSVQLINMPFGFLNRPAVGISILKVCLRERGIQCDVTYPNLMFADWIGLENYQFVMDNMSELQLGDWLFSQALFGKQADAGLYKHLLESNGKSKEEIRKIFALSQKVVPFLNYCMEALEVSKYGIIGFTTNFQQSLSSLALSNLIKTRYPEKLIVFGGAACTSPMGDQLLKSFSWIDFICSGESELSFPTLIESIRAGIAPDRIAGVSFINGMKTISGLPPEIVEDFKAVPMPDYDDFFRQFSESSVSLQYSPHIPIETSRGCWWGVKSHCLFCGKNKLQMEYRSKAPEIVLNEILYMKDRYGCHQFVPADNVIDMSYFKTLFPQLKRENADLSFCFQVRPNLTKRQIKLLRDSGVNHVQVGIESLNTHILKLMEKGSSLLQNIQVLKWCREYNIDVFWNLLYGAPGESPDDYINTILAIDFIHHLQTPINVTAIRLERFSPLFDNQVLYGLENVRPLDSYQALYPLPEDEITDLAFLFSYEYNYGFDVNYFVNELDKKLKEWINDSDSSLSKVTLDENDLLIIDNRANRRFNHLCLTGMDSRVFEFCDEKRSFNMIRKYILSREAYCSDVKLQKFLEEMIQLKIMMQDEDVFLSLAVKLPSDYLHGHCEGSSGGMNITDWYHLKHSLNKNSAI